MKIIITRPEPAATQTEQRLLQNGYQKPDLVIAPLLTIKEQSDQSPPPQHDAIIFTSANAVKHTQEIETNKPAFVVGSQTEKQARERGYTIIHNANGTARDLEQLVRQKTKKGTTLYFPHGKHLAYDLAKSLQDHAKLIEQTTYETLATQELPKDLTTLLHNENPAILMLYSKRTAETLCTLIDKYALQEKLHTITLLCISPSVLEYVQSDKNKYQWHKTYSAERPDEKSMLSALKKITTTKP